MTACAGVLFTAAIGLPQWYEAGEKALESTQLITDISVFLVVFSACTLRLRWHIVGVTGLN